MQSIIIGGKPSSGKTTIQEELGKALGWKTVDAGTLFRQEAEKQGVDIYELSKKRTKDNSLDKKIDADLIEIARKGGAVMQSRTLAFLLKQQNIPAFSVFLETSKKVRKQRAEGREKILAKAPLDKLDERDRNDWNIYKNLYGIDMYDLSGYDLVVNTDDKTPAEIVDFIVERLPDEVTNK